MIQKNDVVRILITDQTDTGEGLGKVDGFPLFVKHAVTASISRPFWMLSSLDSFLNQ